MIKSKYCLLNNNNNEIQNKNECKYDLGGYFIINGNEKVIVCQEKIAENKVYAWKKLIKMVQSSHVEIKSVPNQGFNTAKNVSVKLIRDIAKGRCLKVTIPHCRIDVPLFVLFRAFGIESDKKILEYIMYNIGRS